MASDVGRSPAQTVERPSRRRTWAASPHQCQDGCRRCWTRAVSPHRRSFGPPGASSMGRFPAQTSKPPLAGVEHGPFPDTKRRDGHRHHCRPLWCGNGRPHQRCAGLTRVPVKTPFRCRALFARYAIGASRTPADSAPDLSRSSQTANRTSVGLTASKLARCTASAPRNAYRLARSPA